MKTPERTDNTHEQQICLIYELKYGRSKFLAYFITAIILLSCCYLWGVEFPKLIKSGVYNDGIVRLLMASTLSLLLIIFVMSISGDIYFYDQYVERQSFLPFIKPLVIYYDEMHVYILNDDTAHRGHLTLSPYRTSPEFWKPQYKCIGLFPHPYRTSPKPSYPPYTCSPYYTPEILEFVKTKAQSFNYYDKW